MLNYIPPLRNVDRFNHPRYLIDECNCTSNMIKHFDIPYLFPWHWHVFQKLQYRMWHIFQSTIREMYWLRIRLQNWIFPYSKEKGIPRNNYSREYKCEILHKMEQHLHEANNENWTELNVMIPYKGANT